MDDPSQDARQQEFMQTVSHMRLQVGSLTGSVITSGPQIAAPHLSNMVYTVQLSIAGSPPASVQLTAGGSVPFDAPSAAMGSRQAGQALCIKVFAMGGQEPVAEAVVPLEHAWRVRFHQ